MIYYSFTITWFAQVFDSSLASLTVDKRMKIPKYTQKLKDH